jgi:putative nucleotidyltransferase with HDIG domain
MSTRNQFKLLIGGLTARRGAEHATAAMGEFLERSRLVAALIFIVTVATIALISSVGLTTVNVPVLPDQIAGTRVTAITNFSYESAEKTRAAREQYLDRVPPVYRLDLEPLQRFEAAARLLQSRLAATDSDRPTSQFRRTEFAAIADAFNAQGNYHATAEDIAALAAIEPRVRAALFDNGVAALRDLYREGITDSSMAGAGPERSIVFQVNHANGGVGPLAVQSMEEALTLLRVSLANDTVPRASAQALFRLFRAGLTPNLVFDRAATLDRQNAAAQTIRPVIVNVARGQTIIEPGERIRPEQYEMFVAHRDYIRSHEDADVREGFTLFGRVLLVLAMVLASLIYIRIEDPETLRSNVRCGLLALVVIGNLALIRANYSLGGAEFFLRDGSWASTLPYVAPTAFAPLIVAILIDAGSGIFMALLISIFTGVIYGNRLDLLVLTFLASLVAIYFARDARRRSRLVRAAGAGGLTVAAFAALIGFAEQTQGDTLMRQMVAGLATGVLTGIAVVGLLPVLESLFKRTTDITLLELTDYNHPLLRRMQMEAPGTYHHSLVVAQLAENAANAIGANPLVARVCALFHDVGKTENPRYFAENQRDRLNPHDQLTPIESAQIIKRHVPDGVALAEQHQLPRAVIDVIRQHHGTTLVQYFYDRAAEQAPAGATATEAFRYDGPTPQFKESAIISLADVVEAATRSLREANPTQLAELINRVVNRRIAEGQLDTAPLTLEELTRVRNSFQFTLLNMLHSRVAYPPAASDSPVPVRIADAR